MPKTNLSTDDLSQLGQLLAKGEISLGDFQKCVQGNQKQTIGQKILGLEPHEVLPPEQRGTTVKGILKQFNIVSVIASEASKAANVTNIGRTKYGHNPGSVKKALEAVEKGKAIRDGDTIYKVPKHLRGRIS